MDKYGDSNQEGRLITFELPQFFLVNVYTPNSKNDLSRLGLHASWDAAFLSYVCGLQSRKPVIFCGDLNVAHTELDLARPKSNRGQHGFTDQERSSIDRLIDSGFIDSFRLFHSGNGHYTWWSNFGSARTKNIGWRVDYFFASSVLQSHIISAGIHPHFLGFDHCPITLKLHLPLKRN